MSSEGANLQAISKAIDHHKRTCQFPAVEIRMNPYEAERLGWDEIRGVPIVEDPKIGTGRFRLICAQMKPDGETVEAVAETTEQGKRTVLTPA